MSTRLDKLLEMEKQKPGDSFLNFAIAQEYINSGDDKNAMQYFEFLLREQPAYVPAYYHAGQLCERLNQTEKALDIYRTGFTVAQNTGDHKTAGELKEAIILLED